MRVTSINRTFALAGLAPAGRLSHRYCRLLPVLALSIATPAWSQTALAADTAVNAHYKFIAIGPQNAQNAYAAGINNAGLVTGFYEDLSSNYHGFVWQNGVFQTVDYPGATDTFLYGVNNFGVAIGGYGDSFASPTNHAATYTVQSGTWTELPDIPNHSLNFGYGINDSGVAVGDAPLAGSSATGVGWAWDPTTLSYAFLSVPGAQPYSTVPDGLNDKGQVVGYAADASYAQHGFIEEGGVYTAFNVPGAADTFPLGIDNRGTIVGGWINAAGTLQGFLMTSSGHFINVDYPGPQMTQIDGINERGDLCGIYSPSSNGPFKAFIALAQ